MECVIKDKSLEPEIHEISEGQAKIKTVGKVFYNPVQEFNRDLSISVLTTFAKKYEQEKIMKGKSRNKEENASEITTSAMKEKEVKDPGGITILEALSATGLRSIRYAKEIPGVEKIIANDISARAVDNIKYNVAYNEVDDLVVACKNDAV